MKVLTDSGVRYFWNKIKSHIKVVADGLNDKLSKSEGGEVNKPITITNENSNYKIILSDNGTLTIFNKKYGGVKLLEAFPSQNNIILSCSSLFIKHLVDIEDTSNKKIYSNKSFYANSYIINDGTNKQVLLADGSITTNLVKSVNFAKRDASSCEITTVKLDDRNTDFTLPSATDQLAGVMTATDKQTLTKVHDIAENKAFVSVDSFQNDKLNGVKIDFGVNNELDTYSIYIENATSTVDGCMSHADKAKLDSIPTKYIPTSDGVINESMTFNEDIYFNNDIYITGTIYGKNRDDGVEFIGCNGIQHFNQYDAIRSKLWNAEGGTIDISEILINAAIHVYGDIVGSTEGNITNDVIDNPESIVFDKNNITFLAKKNGKYSSHWTSNAEANISDPGRYGIVDNEHNIVKPFAKQMYKFTNSGSIYVFNANNGNMEPLTFN